VGDKVVGMLGWSEMGVDDGSMLKKVDTTHIPLSAYLGAVGMPGMTAWYGLTQIIKPKEGDTIAVSAASGAVGGVVGQLAKARGCRVIGIAGGKEKCSYVIDELGFDACIDYKGGNLYKDVKAAAPNGIDGLFEILNKHAPLVSALGKGQVKVLMTATKTEAYTIKSGFVEVANNKTTVLVEGVL
jgi:NADPH-dependent curcumin reductase CurA